MDPISLAKTIYLGDSSIIAIFLDTSLIVLPFLCISMPPLSLCCCYSKLLDKGVFFYSDFPSPIHGI